MRRNSLMSIVAIIVITIGGCAKQPTKEGVDVKQQQVKPQENFDSNLDKILQERASLIEIRGIQNSYKEGQSISFIVDTKGKVGYLYLISVDKSKVTFLQPNPVSPLAQMRGVRSFPEDFTNGAFDIRANKNCKGCQQEKTTIYAFLSKKPINGIEKKITGDNLLSFYKNSQQAKIATKGINVNIKKSSNPASLSIAKADFIVE